MTKYVVMIIEREMAASSLINHLYHTKRSVMEDARAMAGEDNQQVDRGPNGYYGDDVAYIVQSLTI